jgi:hypothetical protein
MPSQFGSLPGQTHQVLASAGDADFCDAKLPQEQRAQSLEFTCLFKDVIFLL